MCPVGDQRRQHRMLQVFADQLYSTDCRTLCELIQNADDNTYITSSASGTASGNSGSSSLSVGTAIWIPCKENVWRAAEVVEIVPGMHVRVRAEEENDLINIPTTNNTTTTEQQQQQQTSSSVSGGCFYLRNLSTWCTSGLSAPEDLTQLPHLHEPAVLNSLHVRFDIDLIYTYTGPILIAVNPFKRLMGLYEMDTLIKYISKTTTTNEQQRRGGEQQQQHTSTTTSSRRR
eukprot:GHVS01082654.1.p1 GENE.GHVS01082654.1~~GHVS01082654.1.p1  ORF type:complete len:231 (-),score=75.08 GHVS01082654.1:51-743(-)